MDLTEITCKLISFKTVTSATETNLRALVWCRGFLKKSGIKAEIKVIENRPLLLWGSQPNEAEIMINSHMDVMPGDNDLFSPRKIGGRIRGRGSLDTKSAVATMLNITENTARILPEKKLMFAIVTDEE